MSALAATEQHRQTQGQADVALRAHWMSSIGVQMNLVEYISPNFFIHIFTHKFCKKKKKSIYLLIKTYQFEKSDYAYIYITINLICIAEKNIHQLHHQHARGI